MGSTSTSPYRTVLWNYRRVWTTGGHWYGQSVDARRKSHFFLVGAARYLEGCGAISVGEGPVSGENAVSLMNLCLGIAPGDSVWSAVS
jgi:hypothetical protein